MDTGYLRNILKAVLSSGSEYSQALSVMTDEELVREYTESRNEAAFEEIMNRYMDKVYGFSFRFTKNPDDAEEVFQEVFLTLARKIDTFRGDAKFSSWLYRVTMNVAFMFLRSKKKSRNEISLDNYAPYDEKGTLMGKVMDKDWSRRPDIAIFSKEAMEIIERAVDELPESYRIVFHLRDVEGLNNSEVSDILEISVPAVKSRLHRARLYLRDKLSDYFYEWRK